ncbi:MAG: tetratricopeptide repeat-containing sensor histidine kinase [Panacibacter sp.]
MNLINIKGEGLLLCLLVISCAFYQRAWTQQRDIDSISSLLQKYPAEDSVKVDLIKKLSSFYQAVNLGKAEFYATSALELAEKIKDNRAACSAMSQLGSVYSWQRFSSKALDIYFKERELAVKIKDEYWLQDAYLGIGYVYELENEWDKALDYTMLALPFAEKSDDPFVKAFAYTNLGSEYLGLKNNDRAEYYLRLASKLFNDNDYTDQYANNEINLAKVFVAKRKYDSAKFHFSIADSIFSALDQPYQVADVCQQIGDMYVQIGNYKLAEKYYKRTIQNYNKNDIAEADYALAVMGLGVVALSEKKYETASRMFHDEFSKVKAAGIIDQQLNYLRYMAKVDSATGNYLEAYNHMQEYTTLNERFKNEEKAKAAQRMIIEFDVQKKDKENEQLKIQNGLQRQQVFIFGGMGIVLLFTGVFLASLYRQKTIALAALKEEQNITETKNNELAVINSIRDKLISMIAHDVRAPLTSLQNTLYLTREKIINPEEFSILSQILDNDIRHLISMLDNTLLWAREQIHVLNVDKVNFNLYEVSEDVIGLYNQSIIDKRLMIKNEISPELNVVSDREIIHTVLRNMLSNAIKFTPPGKQISLHAYPMPAEVLVHIKDEGSGISYGILEKISRKEFISTRGTNNEKGTGLGLMFSYDLLAKLNESLTIKTEPDEGTTVIFSITPPDESKTA